MKMQKGKQFLQTKFKISLNQIPYFRRYLPKTIINLLDKCLFFSALNDFYEKNNGATPKDFINDTVKNQFKFKIDVDPKAFAKIPNSGALIILANHPLGGAEALVLASILFEIRSDIKFLANYLLAEIPPLKDLFIKVDPFAKQPNFLNLKGLREAVNWIRAGKVLIIFPAGEVAHLSLKNCKITESEWNIAIARLIHITQAPVLPIYFGGRNSWRFQLIGVIHPILRTILLPAELRNKKEKTISVRIGQIFPYQLVKYLENSTLIKYLRKYTLALKKQSNSNDKSIIAPSLPKKTLRQEISALSSQSLLVRHGRWLVYTATALEIPNLLCEIGRLREITFRRIGEGSNKSLDIDGYDYNYHHLFVWDNEAKCLVGAYRYHLITPPVSSQEYGSLYLTSLFNIDKKFFEKLGPCIELGRAFVRPKYQGNPMPMLFLWKGIGALVMQNPMYYHLLGSLSISNIYCEASKQAIISFMSQKYGADVLSEYVSGKTPFVLQKNLKLAPNFAQLDRLVKKYELGKRSLPPLLKGYFTLGAKFVAASDNDPAFGNCLDFICLVNLATSPNKVLYHYMSKEFVDKLVLMQPKIDNNSH